MQPALDCQRYDTSLNSGYIFLRVCVCNYFAEAAPRSGGCSTAQQCAMSTGQASRQSGRRSGSLSSGTFPAKRPRISSILDDAECPVCGAADVDEAHVNLCLDGGARWRVEDAACPICQLPQADDVHVNKCLDSSMASSAPAQGVTKSEYPQCPVCGESASPGHVDLCIDDVCPASPQNSNHVPLDSDGQGGEKTLPHRKCDVEPIGDWLGPQFAKYSTAFANAGIVSVSDIRTVPQPIESFLQLQCGVSALGPRKKLGRKLQRFLAESQNVAAVDSQGQALPHSVVGPRLPDISLPPKVEGKKPPEKTRRDPFGLDPQSSKKLWDIFSPNFRADPAVFSAGKGRKAKGPHGSTATPGGTGGGRPRQHAFSHRVPGTSFTVDSFRGPKSDPCRRFFLTHFHSDHYGGLTKSSMPSGAIVLCTSVTAGLVKALLRVPSERIQVLPSDGRSVDIPDTVDRENGVTVRCFNANHCPGAVVMLFYVWKTKRNILHCGDCRYDPAIFSKHKVLAEAVAAGVLDYIHLDTTYCDPRYIFPYQPSILESVVAAAFREDKRTSRRCLFFFGTYSIGKEKVFMAVANALNLHLFCSKRKRGILESLDIPGLKDRLVNKPGDARVHVVSMRDLSCDGIKSYAKHACLNRDFIGKGLAIIVRPTGWSYNSCAGDGVRRSVRSADQAITYDVAYSEHSSFSELQDFVAWTRAARLVPTVNCRSAADAENIHRLLGHKNRPLRPIHLDSRNQKRGVADQ